MKPPHVWILVWWVMVLVIGVILPVTLLMHARRAREAARAMDCIGQLKQLGLALDNYQKAHGHLPPASVTDAAGIPVQSWRVSFLPEWTEHVLSGRYDLSVPWYHPKNARLLSFDTPAYFYWCPSGDGRATKFTSYVAVIGPETAWPGSTGLELGEITDDPASTVLLLEVANSGIHWMEPLDPTLDEVLASGLSSNHEGYVNALFADFRVRRVRTSVTRPTLRALLTVNGGERIETADWAPPLDR